jgi:hypothetical protein
VTRLEEIKNRSGIEVPFTMSQREQRFEDFAWLISRVERLERTMIDVRSELSSVNPIAKTSFIDRDWCIDEISNALGKADE